MSEGWGPQSPPPFPRDRRPLGCLAYLGLGFLAVVIAAYLGQYVLSPGTANSPLFFVGLFVGLVLLAKNPAVLRRLSETAKAALNRPERSPAPLSRHADPLAAVQAEAARHGGGTYVGVGERGEWIGADAEHAVLLLGPPRSGKTSRIIVPTILAVPGPLVSTSTKPELLHTTGAARRRRGTVWLFDPAGAEPVPDGVRQLRWSPLRSAQTWDGALVMAQALVAASPAGRADKDSHWAERATALLGPLLHAAALDSQTMATVHRWVLRADLDSPGRVLEAKGAAVATDVLVGIATTAEKERSSIFSTTAGVLAVYNADGARQVATDPNFDPATFVRSGDTIYVTAPGDKQTLAAPLVVGLLEDIRRATYARARSGQSGPPVVFALDECANIAPLHDLPAMVSEGGGQGLHVLACFQDLSQVRYRWGRDRADGFLSMFGTKIILSGIADSETLNALSLAFGEYERTRLSYTETINPAGPRGGLLGFGRPLPSFGNTWSSSRERVLSPGEIAKLPPGCALFVEGVRWRLVRLTPYFASEPWVSIVAAPTTPVPLTPAVSTEVRVLRRRLERLADAFDAMTQPDAEEDPPPITELDTVERAAVLAAEYPSAAVELAEALERISGHMDSASAGDPATDDDLQAVESSVRAAFAAPAPIEQATLLRPELERVVERLERAADGDHALYPTRAAMQRYSRRDRAVMECAYEVVEELGPQGEELLGQLLDRLEEAQERLRGQA